MFSFRKCPVVALNSKHHNATLLPLSCQPAVWWVMSGCPLLVWQMLTDLVMVKSTRVNETHLWHSWVTHNWYQNTLQSTHWWMIPWILHCNRLFFLPPLAASIVADSTFRFYWVSVFSTSLKIVLPVVVTHRLFTEVNISVTSDMALTLWKDN